MNNNHLVIMAGGVGSRFWPMSTPDVPKQFIDVLGVGKTLIQLTIERFLGVIPIENIWIVTSKRYINLIKEQIPEVSDYQILLEPCMRNTAPCIAYVTYKIKKHYPSANLIFSPSDHIVLDKLEFRKIISKSLEFTSFSRAIVTLGIKPTRPETGFGYIKGEQTSSELMNVKAFKEKPSLNIAKEYLLEGNYFWNSGIFIWNVNTIISEFENLAPKLALRFRELDSIYYSPIEQKVIDEEFPKCENISIDYAIMEKSENMYVYPSSFGWSDLGTWGSLHNHLNKDDLGNSIVGDSVNLIDCKNCIVHCTEEKKVVIQGLNNYIVAEKNDTLLICSKTEEQEIKEWQK